MANSLLRNNQPKNNPIQIIESIRRMGPSNSLFSNMYKNNPSFRSFADSMKGKTPEQAFSENNLDFNAFRNLRW